MYCMLYTTYFMRTHIPKPSLTLPYRNTLPSSYFIQPTLPTYFRYLKVGKHLGIHLTSSHCIALTSER